MPMAGTCCHQCAPPPARVPEGFALRHLRIKRFIAGFGGTMSRSLVFACALFVSVGLLGAAPSTDTKLAYPLAPRGTVTDNYFGTTAADPYRWLEDVDSPQTVAWVKAEGALTRAYLDAIPQRAAIRAAFSKLINY